VTISLKIGLRLSFPCHRSLQNRAFRIESKSPILASPLNRISGLCRSRLKVEVLTPNFPSAQKCRTLPASEMVGDFGCGCFPTSTVDMPNLINPSINPS